ncbi:MAG TPA: HD domain-containing protein [Candidatus Omnitrophota bacterium]|nr:HD domain-containing protein [Candidatus Omnitrophota bacterium]
MSTSIYINLIVLFFGVLIGLNIARVVILRRLKDKASQQKTPKIPTPAPDRPIKFQEPRYETPASVLEKKIMYENELNLLLKFDQEVSTQFRLDDIAKTVVENAVNIFNVEKCAILLADKNKRELSIRYAMGLTQDLSRQSRVKKGESISGRTMELNEYILIDDIEKDSWFRTNNREQYYRGAILSMPLSIKGEVVGVINLNNKKTGAVFDKDDIRLLKSMSIQTATAIQNAYFYQEIQEGYLRTIAALAEALDARDPYTYRHSSNVTKYAVAIAEEMRLSVLEIENIRRGGLLHDIGKIGIRDEILSKPAKLTDEEYAQIKTHPSKGEEILKSLPFLGEAAKLIRHHHERLNGTGYPDRLPGYKIEMGAKILAVADAFDTMISDRPYRKAMELSAAIDELKRCSGSQFDPAVIEAFLKVLESNPQIIKE